MLQDNDLHLLWKGGFVESRLAGSKLFGSGFPFDKIFNRFDGKSTLPRLEMHGDEDLRFDLFSHTGCLFGIDRKKSSYRDEKDVHWTDLCNLFIAQDMSQVSQMADLNSINLKVKDGIRSTFASFVRIMIGGNPFDGDPFDRLRSTSFDHLGRSR